MSSAENDTHTGRLVWITREQRDWIARTVWVGPIAGLASEWDAAAAAVETAANALRLSQCPESWDIPWADLGDSQNDWIAEVLPVLAALGVPGDTPNKTHNPTKQD